LFYVPLASDPEVKPTGLLIVSGLDDDSDYGGDDGCCPTEIEIHLYGRKKLSIVHTQSNSQVVDFVRKSRITSIVQSFAYVQL
jgi:hypothetical protein